jgi:cytochrome c-type biogenesis protein CcmE
VVGEPLKWKNKALKIHGLVEAGSIKEEIIAQKTHRTFVLEFQGKRIKVRNEGPKPDTFRDLAEVVARGRLVEENGEYVFEASELIAKCPSKYEENQRTSTYGQPPPQPNKQSSGGF